MKRSLVIAALAASANPVFAAGPNSSGGGKAVVCPESVQLLDTFEGRAVFSDRHPAQASVDDALALAEGRLMQTGYSLMIPSVPTIAAAVEHVRSTMRFTDAEIMPTDDSFEVAIPQGCKLEQAAIFLDAANIVIQQGLWDRLSVVDQAGLILHEAVYWIDRQVKDGERDSRRARRAVSLSLSKTWNLEDVKAGLPNAYVLCNSFGTERPTVFAVYEERGFEVMQFLALNGDLLLSKTTAYTLAGFPFLDTVNDVGSHGSTFKTDALYEGGSDLYLSRDSAYDQTGTFLGSDLKIEGRKATYPDWTMGARTLTCIKFN